MNRSIIPYLQVEITTRCNYTCGFCVGRHMPQSDMSFKIFKSIIDTVEEIQHIEMQGEGEPLLNPHFFDMAEYAKAVHPNVKLSFITNGSMFTAENIKKILSIGFHKFYISMESSDPDTFQKIRGGSFDRLKRGLGNFLAARKEVLQKPAVGITVTVLKETLDHIAGISRLYKDYELDGGFIVQPLQTMPGYKKYYDSHMLAQILNRNDGERFNNIIATDNQLKDVISKKNTTVSFYEDLLGKNNYKKDGCPWLIRGAYVAMTGEVTACSYVKDVNKHSFGIFGGNSIDNIIEKRKDKNNTLLSGKIPSMCQSCSIAKYISS